MEQSPPLSSIDIGLSPETFGLEALLAEAGQRLGEEITPRTVRLYATQGLIDRPGKEGRSAIYGRRHLLQLLLIRSLARSGLSLSAIAPLCVLADAELEEQLMDLGLPMNSMESTTLQSAPPADNPALNYLRQLQADSPPSSQRRSQSTASSLLPRLGAPLASSSPTRSAHQSRSRGRDAASRWYRLSLAPGIELHISDAAVIPPPGERRRSWLNRLAERLGELLDRNTA